MLWLSKDDQQKILKMMNADDLSLGYDVILQGNQQPYQFLASLMVQFQIRTLSGEPEPMNHGQTPPSAQPAPTHHHQTCICFL